MGDQVITQPGDDDLERLAEQVVRVGQLAAEHLDADLTDDDSDLDVVQELLDLGAVPPDATYDLQCLGIVFGMRVVEAMDGVDWAIVEDEFGRDPALRYLDTSLLVFPLTMIAKRVEDGEDVDVRDLFTHLLADLEQLKRKVARPS
ncbi:MAG TPA: DUF3806 domain-containing protein [Kofleriaceae bacterium]|nr:DUF3806 domain-containing protein [Kofleriaceae bacterium]